MTHRPAWALAVCDSLEKVYPDSTPRAIDAAIPLIGFRGERVSFQVAARPPALSDPVAVGEILLEVRAPRGTTALISSVELVPVALAAYEDADSGYTRQHPGLYPDLLKPSADGAFSVVVGQWRAGWVDVEVGAACAAGAHEIEVIARSSASGAVIGESLLTLLVPDLDLPSLSIAHTEWFHCDALADAYHHEPFSEENWAVIEQFMASAVRAQVNCILTPVWTPPLDTDVGRYRTTTQLVTIADAGDERYVFDFAPLRRWMAVCRRAGIRTLEMPHLFTQWGARFTPAIIVQTPNGPQRRFGWHVAATDPRYRRLLEQLVPALRQVLDEEWGIAHVVFHISDEPAGDDVTTYELARGVAADLLEGCVIVDALSDHAFYDRGLVDVPVVATDHAEPFLAADAAPIWLYHCVSQSRQVANRFIDLPSVRSRVLGAQLFVTGADGFLHWGFNFYNAALSRRTIDPFTDTCAGGAFLGGDAFLVYPGPDGVPWESIRHRIVAEAFVDHRALRLLESVAGADAARGIADQDGQLRLDSFSYDADHYRRMLHDVVVEIERRRA